MSREECRVTPDWEEEWKKTLPLVQSYREELKKRTRRNVEILRVNQLDALKLDQEINEVLKMQFMKIFTFAKPDFVEKYQPELNAVMQFLIYRYSIFTLGTTYGNLLQNLKFRNELVRPSIAATNDPSPLTTLQKVTYGVLTIGGEWCWARLSRMSLTSGWGDRAQNDWHRKAWQWLSHIENTYKCLSIINFLVFLYNGKYVTLINRLLGMRLVYYKPNMTRRVSFELMNRQLVWHGFTEFLLFLMPLINIERIKGFLYRKLVKPKLVDHTHHTSQHPHVFSCPVCNTDPAGTPYIANCGHIFCYYCLKAGCMADSQFSCPRCGVVVVSMQRWTPLVKSS
jgi:peroxin-2